MRKLGSFTLVSPFGFCQSGRPDWTSSSLTANTPTITRMYSMPPSSSGRPKVNRVTPDCGSVPTMAIIRPRMPVIRPLTSMPSASVAITLIARMPSAK